jgi:hypothetical protein
MTKAEGGVGMPKQTYRYRMDFDSKQHTAAAAFMGGAFFLRITYYFGFTRPESVGAWNLIIFLILPILLEVAYVVMIRAIKMDIPNIYGIMGSVYCLLLLLQCFQSGNVLQIILGCVAYLACAAALLGTGMGMLSKSMTVMVLILVFAVRFLFFDIGGYLLSLRVIGFIREAAALCGILGLTCLCGGLKDRKKKK